MTSIAPAAQLLVLAATAFVAQDYPKPTEKGVAALDRVIEVGLQVGGLKATTRPGSDEPFIEVVDQAKLREAFEKQPALLTPELRETLIGAWQAMEPDEEPLIIALLSLFAHPLDARAGAFAALFTAKRAERAGKFRAAVDSLTQAADLFEQINDRGWQATAKHQIAKVFGHMGEHGASLQAYRNVLEIRLDLYGEVHPLVATTLNNIGVAEANINQLAAALRTHERALAIRRKLYPQLDHPDVAFSFRNIGYVHFRQGHADRALEFALQALEVRERAFQPPHPDLADSLHSVGVLLNELGRLPEALGRYEQALKMWNELGEAHEMDAAAVLSDAGIAAAKLRHFRDAMRHQREALRIREHRLGTRRHPQVASSLKAIGFTALDIGDYELALETTEEAASIFRQFLGEHHPELASCWNNMAVARRHLGDYVQALNLYREALEIWEKAFPRGHPSMAYSMDNMAEIHDLMGRGAEAIAHRERALELLQRFFPPNHPEIVTCLNGLGFSYARAGQPARALEFYQQVLAICRDLPQLETAEATTLLNLGSLYIKQQNGQRALEVWSNAIQRRRVRQLDHGPQHASLCSQTASLLHAQGDTQGALALINEAVTALRIGSKVSAANTKITVDDLLLSPITVDVLAGYAIALEDSFGTEATAPQLRECLEWLTLAVDVSERLREGLIEEETSKLQFGENTTELYPRTIGVRTRLAHRTDDRSHLVEAFRLAELSAARVFGESIARRTAYVRGALVGGYDKPLGELLAQLRRCREQIATEQRLRPEQRRAERVGVLMDQRKQLDRQLHELVAAMEQEHLRGTSFLFPKPCTLEQARACLRPDEVALLFNLGEHASYVLLLTDATTARDTSVQVFPLGPRHQFEEAVAAITKPPFLEATDDVREAGAELFAAWLGPIAELIRGKNLLIVPGGALGQFPFELLVEPDAAGGASQFLFEQHQIRYAPSMTVLRAVREWAATRPGAERPFWAMANPEYGKTDSAFPPLPNSGREVESIARLFSATGDEVSSGRAASEANVKAASEAGQLRRFRYVHFATHGTFGQDAVRQPSLVLSLVDNGRDDGFLELHEVAALELNADLVVLSACSTAQGQVLSGEGVRSLARSFMHAGSRGVLCSLWRVADDSTPIFMQQFYERLTNGEPAATALRNVKRQMAADGYPPLVWAPFILIGE